MLLREVIPVCAESVSIHFRHILTLVEPVVSPRGLLRRYHDDGDRRTVEQWSYWEHAGLPMPAEEHSPKYG